mmetsp:Transcript_2503/g.6433  ORF Transcript_2503/g.6433 Transcript_2503/m.6433 type:complete len:556 (-) Transcript_2503:205-1872(-)|eukprot:CAMPEP_0202858510 /NCGR_PEP_ID=MMETSP1391-20130828/1012_1 /ASSEMBLY_ACC=CAM_ASM_000867 /TAXON_ID=1034604 /ORGANISM="Chlamydomonas leiostraca, Strain SAG 11-49" /LENGTH=555 /DNA_ID=CAMNT_0049537435 /DNA_START=77 /DNA_END=1744 /DNA_ORIENTATION=+
MDSQSTLQLLLNEAQQEVASLRANLYNTRRLAEERRQAVQALTTERDGLRVRVQQLEAGYGSAQTQLAQLQSVQQQYQALQEVHSKLQRDFELSIAARKILESELADERKQRQSIEEAKALLEAERSRQVKAKDDLAAALRVAQRKAAEAEEEQLRAEEEAAAMRAELKALHASGMHAGMDSAMPSSNSSPGAPPDWHEQLEYERNRAATIMNSLHAAKAEVASLTQQLNAHNAHAAAHSYQAAEASQLQTEVGQLRQQLAESHSKAQALEVQLSSTQAQVAALQQQCQQQQEQLQSQAAASHQPSHSEQQSAHGEQQHQGMHALEPPTSHGHHHVSGGGSMGGAAGKPPPHPHHRRQSTSGSASELTGDTETQLQKLQEQVSKLKASRDKLLAQIDKQWEEMDKLAAENKAAGDELDAVRWLSAGWEAQAQDGLAQAERLKEMLEEAAGWSAGQAAAGPQAAMNGYVAAVNGTAPTPQQLEAALLMEKARTAELELQLRALAAELLRSQQASMAIGKAVLPVLSGVEYRLSEMFSRAHSTRMAIGPVGQQGAAA